MSEKIMFPKFQEWLTAHPVKAALIVGFASSVIGGVIGGYILRLSPKSAP